MVARENNHIFKGLEPSAPTSREVRGPGDRANHQEPMISSIDLSKATSIKLLNNGVGII